MSDPVITARYYHPLNLEHLGITYRDTLVAYHGPLRRVVCPGRLVALVPGRVWPAADPEHCAQANGFGEWVAPELLVCPGCGLDCT